jgi:hypothetical protein
MSFMAHIRRLKVESLVSLESGVFWPEARIYLVQLLAATGSIELLLQSEPANRLYDAVWVHPHADS